MRKVAGSFMILGLLLSVSALSAVEKKAIAGALDRIIITPDPPKTKAGESVKIAAIGKDKEGHDVSINPTWTLAKPESGTLSAERGSEVTFTAALTKPGYEHVQATATITVKEGNIKKMVFVKVAPQDKTKKKK